jgi:AraC family transcriptional regulator
LAKAVERRAAGEKPVALASRILAQGDGWTVSDVVCTAGPRDRSFEERHLNYSIAVVAAGSFQYRGGGGSGERFARQVMTPGSLLLGNPRQCYECGHEHGAGDRCISFWYRADFFEKLTGNTRGFGTLRIPPLQATAEMVAQAIAGLMGSTQPAWDELAARFAAETIQLTSGASVNIPRSAEARVTRVVRLIERDLSKRDPTGSHSLQELAREARLSPYHFLRVFECVTGLTPHQYVLRARLREATLRLVKTRRKVLDVALECGFGDVSNFNRAFKREFGLSPTRLWSSSVVRQQPRISPVCG